MITAILLIFGPSGTWDRIALAKRSVIWILFLFLAPMILVSVGVELAGMARWGKLQSFGILVQIPQKRILIYGAVELVLDFAVAFIAARMIKSITGTFVPRHTYSSAFALVSYGLSPLFLVHLLDALPRMYPWVSFGIGIVLAITVVYSGVPRLMEPDPPNAFGVFIASSFLLLGLMGVARLATLFVLMGKFDSLGSAG